MAVVFSEKFSCLFKAFLNAFRRHFTHFGNMNGKNGIALFQNLFIFILMKNDTLEIKGSVLIKRVTLYCF